MRQEIAQEAVAGIEEKASTQDGAKETAQRTAGERVKQKIWTARKSKRRRRDWQKGRRWDEDEKLEETLEWKELIAGGCHAKKYQI